MSYYVVWSHIFSKKKKIPNKIILSVSFALYEPCVISTQKENAIYENKKSETIPHSARHTASFAASEYTMLK